MIAPCEVSADNTSSVGLKHAANGNHTLQSSSETGFSRESVSGRTAKLMVFALASSRLKPVLLSIACIHGY
jgi:hypothetical protein